MRTDAPVNILDNYLTRGKKPRIYIYIPDLDLFLGTRAATIDGTSYGNRLTNAGTITLDAPSFGGFATVSNVTIDNIELDRDVSFSESATIVPLYQSGQTGAGRLIREGLTSDPYDDVRGATSGSFGTSSVVVGRWRNDASMLYGLARGVMQYTPPLSLTSCEDGSIELDGMESHAGAGIELYLVAGTWSAWNTGGLFDDFDGHENGMTAYTGTILSERWHSDEYSATEKNKIRLNKQGRNYVEQCASAGTPILFALLSKADYEGDAAPISDEYIKFHATSARLELRYNTIELTNREAEIYYAYEPTPATRAEMFLRWTGVIHDYEASDETIRLEHRQAKNKHNRYIPDKQITEAEYPACPETNIGKTYPLVIGAFAATTEHRTGVGNFDGNGPITYPINYSYPDCYKAIVVAAEEESKTVLLSEKPVGSHSQPFFVWNGSIGAFEIFHIRTTIIIPLGISQKTLTPRTETTGFPNTLAENQFKALSTIIPYKNEVLGLGISDPEQAYDKDSDTYATIDNDNASLNFYFQRPDGVTGTGAIAFLTYAKFVDGASASDFRMLIAKDERTSIDDAHDWVQIIDQALWTGDGLGIIGFYLFDASNNRMEIPLDQYRMTLYRDTDSTGEVQVYDVCAVAAYNADEVTELYTYGNGLPYGSWVDAAGRDNDYDQGDIIETPPMIVEALAREYMGLASSEIDTSAFDESAGLLANWKMAYELLDMTPSMTHFGEIGEASKSLYTFDEQNRMTVLTHDMDRGFPNAGAATPWKPGELDIFDEAASLTAGVFTNHPIEQGTLTLSPFSEPRNNFKLRYKMNYATNQYERLLYINHGNGVLADVDSNIDGTLLEGGMTLAGVGGLKGLTSRCYNRILTTNTKIIECPLIRDEATATRALQYAVIQYASDLHEVSFATYDNALLHELWDYINIRHRRILTIMDRARMEKQRWKITRIQHTLGTAKILIKAIEEATL